MTTKTGEPEPKDDVEEVTDSEGVVHKVVSRVVEFSGPDATKEINEYIQKAPVDEIPEEPEVITKESVEEYTDDKGVKHVIVRRLIVKKTIVTTTKTTGEPEPKDEVEEVTDSEGVVRKVVQRSVEFSGPDAAKQINDYFKKSPVDDIPEEPETITKEAVKDYINDKGEKCVLIKRLVVKRVFTVIEDGDNEPKDDVEEFTDPNGKTHKVVRRVVQFSGPDSQNMIQQYIKSTSVEEIPDHPEVVTKEEVSDYVDDDGVKHIVVRRLIVKRSIVRTSVNDKVPLDDTYVSEDKEGFHHLVKRIVNLPHDASDTEVQNFANTYKLSEIPQQPTCISRQSVEEFTDNSGITHKIVKILVVKSSPTFSPNDGEPLDSVSEAKDTEIVERIITREVTFCGPEGQKRMTDYLSENKPDSIPVTPHTQIKQHIDHCKGRAKGTLKIIKQIVVKCSVDDKKSEPETSIIIEEVKDNKNEWQLIIKRVVVISGPDAEDEVQKYMSTANPKEITIPAYGTNPKIEELFQETCDERKVIHRIVRHTTFKVFSVTQPEVVQDKEDETELSPGIRQQVINRTVTLSNPDDIASFLGSEDGETYIDPNNVTHRVIRRIIIPSSEEDAPTEYFDEDGNKHSIIRKVQMLESSNQFKAISTERQIDEYMVKESMSYNTFKTVRKDDKTIDTSGVQESEVVEFEPAFESYSGFQGQSKVSEFMAKANDFEASQNIIEEQNTKEDESCSVTRTVTRHMIVGPQIETVQFTGDDAKEKMQQYIQQAESLKNEDVEEYEEEDEDGNVHIIKKHVIVQPEIRTVSFTGPDAQKQLDEFLSSMEGGDEDTKHEESHSDCSIPTQPTIVSAGQQLTDASDQSYDSPQHQHYTHSHSSSPLSSQPGDHHDDPHSAATHDHAAGMDLKHGAFFPSEEHLDYQEEMMRQLQSASQDGSGSSHVVTKTTTIIDEDGNPKTITETVTLSGDDVEDHHLDQHLTEEVDGQSQQKLDEQ